MFQPWRIQLRQAETAWQAGQLDEARRLLGNESLAEFLPAKELSRNVAAALGQRGVKHAAGGDSSAGWRDLEAAMTLAGETEALAELRRQLIAQSVAEAERYLAAEDAASALVCLARLQQRGGETAEVRVLTQVARRMQAAFALIRRNEFLAAEAELGAAARLRPDFVSLQARAAQCQASANKAALQTANANPIASNGKRAEFQRETPNLAVAALPESTHRSPSPSAPRAQTIPA